MKFGRGRFLAGAAVLALAAVFLWAGRTAEKRLAPRLISGVYQAPQHRELIEKLPFSIPGAPAVGEVHLQLFLDSVHASKIKIHADDCLSELRVNGREIAADVRCEYPYGPSFQLAGVLVPGLNNVSLRLHNGAELAQLDLLVAPTDPLALLILGLQIAAAAVAAVAAAKLWRLQGNTRILFYLSVLGILLRAAYLSVTPYLNRAHDVAGHIEYVQYLLSNWGLPPAVAGWEFYHPPLYYAVAAGIVRLSQWWGASEDISWQWVQLMSFLLNCTALVLMLALAKRLICESEKGAFLAAGLFLACSPGLIYSSARITNDVLADTLAAAGLFCLFAWWKSGKWALWYAAAGLIAAGIWTKMNALCLLSVALVLLACAHRRTLFSRAIALILTSALLLTATGWYFHRRLITDGEHHLFGPILNLSDSLKLQNSAAALTTFNPLRIIEHPFNYPWNESEGGRYFLEFFYRSMFFGEMRFGDSAKGIAVLVEIFGLYFTAAALVSAGMTLKRRSSWALPLLTVAFVYFAALAYFRVRYPYAPCQDFRYITPIAIPLAVLAGKLSLIKGLKPVILFAAVNFALFSSLFIALLFFRGPPLLNGQ